MGWRGSCKALPADVWGNSLIVYVLIAALFMLIGVTAVSSIDFSNHKRR